MTKSAQRDENSQGKTILAQLMLPMAAMIRGDVRDLVMSLGIQAIAVMFEQERTELCGPLYVHDAERSATRGGSVPGQLVMGGRKVRVSRPRVVDRNGHRVPLGTWEELRAADPMTDRVLEQMTVGVATRKYARSLEPVPEQLEESGTSKSSVSRRFVEVTEQKLQEWLARPLGELGIRAVFLDGLHFAEHVVIAALGVDAAGKKHVLGIWEGATENGPACRAMLNDLVMRGLDAETTRLFVIDGSGALRAAIRDVFGKRALVQRCQVHKIRNVESHLPKKKQAAARAAMREAYKSTKVETAKRLLNNLARTLETAHPSAAGSIREGLDETLTVMALGLPRTLERSFSTTNPIENLNERIRQISKRVKRWRGGSMILRWTAAGVFEAERGFRRLKGHAQMQKLIAAITPRQSENVVDDHQQVA
ncbi:MAG: IS256 family transposase [Actinobacteria bacterium]|nr:IS256 family transposase [Actinomycetota bacterium]